MIVNIKDKFIEYFVSLGHVEIPSAPLIPENDPSVLFNTAGMQPLIPYLLGERHPLGNKLCDAQKCVRLTDLDDIGDKTHHTFFEMLGNWSLGAYFKEESIKYSFKFLTEVLGIPVEKLAVTVFRGNSDIPRDETSAKIWENLGIKKEHIAYLGEEDNFWIAGDTGPCGGDTEIFYFRSNDEIPSVYDPSDKRWVEIWNNVFMEFNKDKDGKITTLAKKNVDTGMGLERIVAVMEGVDDNYKTSIWRDIIKKIEEISGKTYEEEAISMRIIADHIRTSVFISADNALIKPSNTDQGYVLRRLIRRAIRHAKKLDININSDWMIEIAKVVVNQYENYYSEIKQNKNIVFDVLRDESTKFNRTLGHGLKEFNKLIKNKDLQIIDKDSAFKLYDTYGFPLELTVELAKEQNLKVDEEGFKEKFRHHQELSRSAASGKFKGGLASTGEVETKYHTATHLLNAALKRVIGPDVHQRGSNITSERMRFDFSCDHKLSDEEKRKVQELVNAWIKADIPVTMVTMSKDEAVASGAEAMFIEKYADVVNVYNIGDVSSEICGGPHVKRTGELGTFKIKKEEASSAGVRRIKAILE